MNSFQFSALFISALLLTTIAQMWLARRHLTHIHAHRAEVPSDFREQIDLSAHQKAADYTSDKTRLTMPKARA